MSSGAQPGFALIDHFRAADQWRRSAPPAPVGDAELPVKPVRITASSSGAEESCRCLRC
ncbi:MAG: hypothetical protein MZV49_14940 [Rhodopseudomonas palustris]|nr:hypothetical protein [Rhodopseudomonas palustris]